MAKMALHDITSPDADERDRIIDDTRHCAGVIKLWIGQRRIEALQDTRNVKLSSRMEVGGGGTYVLSFWYETADMCVKGAKVLRGDGRIQEGNSLAEDAGFIAKGLKELGMVYPNA